MRGLKVLFVLGAVALLGLGAVWMIQQTNRPAARPDDGPVVEWDGITPPLTIEGAAARAEERARAWQPDAVLVRVETTWRPGPERLNFEYLPVTWSFYYYSASAGQLASAAVNAANTFWVPPMPMLEPPQPLTTLPPMGEAGPAWLVFQAAGGDEFIHQHPDATVSLVLCVQDGRPTWTVQAISQEHHLQVRMDAATGLALP